MITYELPDIKIFESNEGWETLFERSYKFDLFSDIYDEKRYEKEGEDLIRTFVDTNEVLLSVEEYDRQSFCKAALAANKITASQNADMEIRYHAKAKTFCIRITSQMFMLLAKDLGWLSHLCVRGSYMEIESLGDEEKKSVITVGVSLNTKSKLIDYARNIVY